jgi:hypothetical protein
VQARDSQYDLAVGTNLLLGGLWEPDDSSATARRGQDVLIISLNEETNLDLGREALALNTGVFTARKTSIPLDNGHWIRWRRHDALLGQDVFTELLPKFGRPATVDAFCQALVNAGLIIHAPGYRGPAYVVPPETSVDLPSIMELAAVRASPQKTDFGLALQGLLLAARDGEDHWGGDKPARDPDQPILRPECRLHDLASGAKNHGKKVVFNKWCVHLRGPEGGSSNSCAKVVIATCRSGCISPEEFLRTLQKILDDGSFARVLFVSTALLGQRFPLLQQSDLLIEALIALFKSRNMVSVIIDPQAKPNKDATSLCLTALADYLIELRPHEHNPPAIAKPDNPGLVASLTQNRFETPWSEMRVRNARGKNYTDVLHLVTARPLARFLSPESQGSLSDRLQSAGPKGDLAKLKHRLYLWGFLAKDGDINTTGSTELAYMSKQNFTTVFGSALSKWGFDASLVWSALNYFRPSASNELYMVNAQRNTPNAPAWEPTPRPDSLPR